jgi:hypothetical protein
MCGYIFIGRKSFKLNTLSSDSMEYDDDEGIKTGVSFVYVCIYVDVLMIRPITLHRLIGY